MTEAAPDMRSVIVERDLPHSPDKIWRVLTQAHLIEEWLMKNDFQPVVGHCFSFRAEWGTVDCRVVTAEPDKILSYTWAAHGLESVVTWTLSPAISGTRLRMEQSGFRPGQQQFYEGARSGWQRFIAALEQVAARVN